mmetsp:Transcript_71859/g.126943  ORF Transcript_71859/g.126943 Transcript_71859/m.126943 type:complete len:228 (+) Transcript_71859:229-912(+)
MQNPQNQQQAPRQLSVSWQLEEKNEARLLLGLFPFYLIISHLFLLRFLFFTFSTSIFILLLEPQRRCTALREGHAAPAGNFSDASGSCFFHKRHSQGYGVESILLQDETVVLQKLVVGKLAVGVEDLFPSANVSQHVNHHVPGWTCASLLQCCQLGLRRDRLMYSSAFCKRHLHHWHIALPPTERQPFSFLQRGGSMNGFHRCITALYLRHGFSCRYPLTHVIEGVC